LGRAAQWHPSFFLALTKPQTMAAPVTSLNLAP
jgi:hypothetical protein